MNEELKQVLAKLEQIEQKIDRIEQKLHTTAKPDLPAKVAEMEIDIKLLKKIVTK